MFCSQSDEQAQRDVQEEEPFAHHMPRFKVFMEALKGCEAAKIRNETLQDFVGCPGRALLGGAMPSSMIYWSFIDPHRHSFFATIEQKVELLSPCREGAKVWDRKRWKSPKNTTSMSCTSYTVGRHAHWTCHHWSTQPRIPFIVSYL
jgi:hypothetical protein